MIACVVLSCLMWRAISDEECRCEHLGNVRLPMQFDVGIGDAVTPSARRAAFPVLLGMDIPKILVYPRETYVVEENVGRSTMPIELAVRHPNAANRHLLAIEFDGPMYASQKTVRDRDVLRPAILGNLGWKHFRLWSMDWVFDRKRVRQRLLDALDGCMRDSVLTD